MVRDGEGQVTSLLSLPNSASKGKKGGREVSLCPELVESLRELHAWSPQPPRSDDVIFSERNQGMSAAAVAVRFKRLYDEAWFKGCSSHSGRRTFITRAAPDIIRHGGSLRDVQQMAGHSSLNTTQRYIEGNLNAKRAVVDSMSARRSDGLRGPGPSSGSGVAVWLHRRKGGPSEGSPRSPPRC
jgi:integrase/recombinase XerD